MPNTIRVLVQQFLIPEYRKPFFCELSKVPGLEVVVASGTSLPADVGFTHLCTPTWRIGPVVLQPKAVDAIRSCDVAVLQFDIRNLTIWSPSVLASRCRTLLWGHGFGASRGAVLARPIRQMLIRIHDGAILYGNASRDALLASGVPDDKLHVARNTLHVPNAGRDQGLASTFLFVGRFTQIKRIDWLLTAFSYAIRSIDPAIRLRIVGSGTVAPGLRELTRQLGIQHRVEWLPWTDDPSTLRKLYSEAIAYVSPGAVGLGCVQAFAYATPVVCTTKPYPSPEYQYLQHRDNALLFNNSVDSLASTMVDLANSDSLRESLSCGAKDYFNSHLGIANMVAGFVAAIHACRLR